MSLLIDADYIVYKACASCETEIDFGDDVIVVTSKFSEVMETIDRELYSIASDLGCFDDFILFFSSSRNFRKLLYPAYKGHRNRKKPCGYRRTINALKKEYPVIVNHYLEADDSIGIYATKDPGHIIVSPDKDMRQILVNCLTSALVLSLSRLRKQNVGTTYKLCQETKQMVTVASPALESNVLLHYLTKKAARGIL